MPGRTRERGHPDDLSRSRGRFRSGACMVPVGYGASAPDPPFIPRRDAEGGGRVSLTRVALLAEDRKRALPARPPGDLSPSVPLSGTPDGRGSLARNQPPPPSLPGPIRSPGGFPVGTGPTPLRCATRTAGRNAGGFSGRHPGTAAGPLAGIAPVEGFRRRGRRSPPATTGAGSETPPLGRKGRAGAYGRVAKRG